jgi:hypothetical protein
VQTREVRDVFVQLAQTDSAEDRQDDERGQEHRVRRGPRSYVSFK